MTQELSEQTKHFPAYKLTPGAHDRHSKWFVNEQVAHEESHAIQLVPDRENPIRHEVHSVNDVHLAHPTGHKTGTPATVLITIVSDGEFTHVPSALTEYPILQVVQVVASVHYWQFWGQATQFLSAELIFGWTKA